MDTQARQTLTFLFTDIVGSTPLWERQPEAMSRALALHDSAMRQAIQGNRGNVFKTVGDAFCTVFTDAEDAVQAAVAAQVALRGVAIDSNTPLLVRMALCAGAAELREGDYFGQTVNKVARIVGLAHGGQVLLSGSTYELLKASNRIGIDFKPLGGFELRGIGTPEELYQLIHPDLRAEFPPLAGGSETPNNLPQHLTSFIGRESDLTQLLAAMQRSRLVTITGAGGSGKTRLALEAAGVSLTSFPDGVWFAELVSVTEESGVIPEVCAVLGIQPEPGINPLESLCRFFRDKTSLLVLDNCEHLLIGAAELTARLLRSAANLQILTTSREALNIGGEVAFRIPSLSLPPADFEPRIELLKDYDAIGLFIDRASAADPSFVASDDNAPDIVHICRRLDGIPLAIELAVSRLRTMHVRQLAERLDDRFRILTGGSRTAISRQRTLRALIDWSYNLLDESERRVLCTLSIFVGGWDIEAAEAVASDDGVDQIEVLDILMSLVEKSMVMLEPSQGGSTRYTMLETIRQYANEKLDESGAGEAVRNRHSDFFRGLFDSPIESPEDLARFERLRANTENIHAAFVWTLGMDPMRALEWGARMSTYFHGTQRISEGVDLLSRALSLTESEAHSPVRVVGLMLLANLQLRKGEYEQSHASAEQARRIAEATGDELALAKIIGLIGNVELAHGRFDQARMAFLELRDRGRASANPQLEGMGSTVRFSPPAPWAISANSSLRSTRQIGCSRRQTCPSIEYGRSPIAAHTSKKSGTSLKVRIGTAWP